MPIYEVKVEVRAYRNVTIEADSLAQAVQDANIEAIRITGAFRAEVVEIKKEADTEW
jgi:hypothetical protein